MFQQNTKPTFYTVNEWKKVLETEGSFPDEAFLLSSLKYLNEETDAALMAQILVLATKSRASRRGKDDHFITTWMNLAKELDSNNSDVINYTVQFEWRKKAALLDSLVFPTLRETDNRAAKKSVAEDIIMICQQFLKQSEVEVDSLEMGHQLSYQQRNGQLENLYKRLIQLYEETIEIVVGLHKAAQEYDQSISGVFHTAIHFQDVKVYLDRLHECKLNWNTLFTDELETPSDETDALDTLTTMIGMNDVKQRVNQLYQFLKYQQDRKQKGFLSRDEQSLHMIITGNPGTGKTTLVRLLAKIYYELGILPRKEVIETDRSKLVGAFVGQTEENVRRAVEQSVGGVLFIDEAYSLKREGQTGNDYGQTAIDTLVSLMTSQEYGGKFAVILAGYTEDMRQFLEANSGLRSRFPRSNFIHLEDYTNEELLQIAEKFAADNDYLITPDAKKELSHRLEMERVDDSFGNARTVRAIVLDAIFKKGSRQDLTNVITDYTLLDRDDFYVEQKSIEQPAHERLEGLIGLKNVKDEVAKLIGFVKAQRKRSQKGLPTLPIQLHSVFTGNPGTGKTTVAKIYAQALKECGLLKRGHLIVTSRADFIAGYVGQTAIKTKKKIREALGGVLFIDEAYSLISRTEGDFGREMIDTLVDEMTKHNENLVVILAGYPEEMDKLLESNPGLQSRFKKFYHFPDYNVTEMIEIMEKYAAQFGYELSEDAKNLLLDSLSQYTLTGNGRFATNVMDECIQIQSCRILEQPSEEESILNKEDVTLSLQLVGRGE